MLRSFTNTLSRGMILAGVATLAACSTDVAPTAPSLVTPKNPAASLASPTAVQRLSTVQALGRMKAVGANVTTSKAIGPAGGSLTLPEAGLTLVVPAGAVDSVVTFRATALPGNAIAYEFAPHGLTFKKALQFQQNLGRSTWLPGLSLGGGYFKDRAQVDTKSRGAVIDEPLGAVVRGGTVILNLWHFSGYLVSMA